MADSGCTIPRSDGPLCGFDSELAGIIQKNLNFYAPFQ